ncbi:MAG: hypothetical protein ACOC5T_01900 [Elusimicrobiota bacterium]
MIEDKEKKIKIAENKKEADWENVRQKAEDRLKNLNIEKEINKAIIKLAEKKIKEN